MTLSDCLSILFHSGHITECHRQSGVIAICFSTSGDWEVQDHDTVGSASDESPSLVPKQLSSLLPEFLHGEGEELCTVSCVKALILLMRAPLL